MGEKAKSIGEKLEGFGKKLYARFGWKELLRDKEIVCEKASHKKKTHGIDLLHSTIDPYNGQNICIFTECKNRQWENIYPSNITKWVQEFEYTIECSQNSPEINNAGLSGCISNVGILLIHANDGKFDKNKFYDYLSEASFRAKRLSPMSILVAGNDKIDKWNALLDEVSSISGDFNYIYPCVGHSRRQKGKYLAVNHLFSKFLFGQRIYKKEIDSKCTITVTQNMIFSFDINSLDSFKYLASAFKCYQFEEGDEYVFYFYPESPSEIDYIKQKFEASLPLDKDGKSPFIDVGKIQLKFLNNRFISPVEY
jgi:hypothetical protein